jgi:putative DNA primase/helicase
MSAVPKAAAPPADEFESTDEARQDLEQFVRDPLSDFYGSLLPAAGQYVLFIGPTKKHIWCGTIDELTRETLLRATTPDVYFALSSFKTTEGRTQENALLSRAFYFDIDAGPEKFAKHGDKVYLTQKAAIHAVVGWVKKTGLTPSLLVSSGAGLHVYYALDRDVPIAEWQPVAESLKAMALATGLKIDAGVTADSARVLRPVGTLHKSGETVKALTTFDGVRSFDWVREKTEGYAAKAPARRVSRLNDEILSAPVGPPKSLERIQKHCPAMAHAMNLRGDVSEPYWRAMIGVIKHTVEGEAAAHMYSRGDPKYDYAETQKKFDLWNAGPATCATFETENAAACATCAYKGKVKSPALLGWERTGPVGVDDAEHSDEDPRATDLALASLWGKRQGAGFRYDHSRRDWMHWMRGTWAYCTKEQHVESFKHVAGTLMQQAGEAMAGTGGSDRAKRLLACAQRAQSAGGTKAALSLAQSAPAVAVRFEELDRDPDLFNSANGVVHLPTGELRQHDPALMLHRQSPVAYDPEAKCPQFMEFMRQVSCDDDEWVSYLQTALGYALSGHVTEERAQFWLGNGANGKSVLANVMRYIFGTYAATAPSAFLMQSRREAGGATPELAMLPGVRMLLANEVEAGSKLSAQTLKVAVSTEHMAARALYGNPFSFKPTHKLFVRGNHRPIITDDDEGIWRRIDLVPFDLNLAPEDRDHALEGRLLTEAPGILRWMVEGFARWRREGLRQPRRVRDASLAYRRDSDVLGQWLDDACDVAQGLMVPQRTAYVAFRQWCVDQGLRCPAKKSFTRSLKERGVGESREGSGTRAETYTGIRLKS